MSQSLKSKVSIIIESEKSSEFKPTIDPSLPKFAQEKLSNNSLGKYNFEKNRMDKTNKPLFASMEKIRSEIITKSDIESKSKLQAQFNDMQLTNPE